ncbi:MAG: hypothetical protein V1936_05105 [Patescibacteria group bacterium]
MSKEDNILGVIEVINDNYQPNLDNADFLGSRLGAQGFNCDVHIGLNMLTIRIQESMRSSVQKILAAAQEIMGSNYRVVIGNLLSEEMRRGVSQQGQSGSNPGSKDGRKLKPGHVGKIQRFV